MNSSSLLGFRPTPSPAWTIIGTGAAFLSSVELGGGNPAIVTRVQWLSDLTPATTDYVALRCTFAALRVGLFVLRGLTVPVGTKIEIWGKRAGDAGYTYNLGGNTQTQRTTRLYDGSVGASAVPAPGNDEIVSYEVRIFNDVDGNTWATDATWFDIGEIQGFETVEIGVVGGYTWETVDETEHSFTLGSQGFSAERRPCRAVNIDLIPTPYAIAMAAGTGLDWQTVNYELTRGNRCALALRGVQDGVLVDADQLQRETVFGMATRFGPIAHVANARRLFTNGWRIREIPGV